MITCPVFPGPVTINAHLSNSCINQIKNRGVMCNLQITNRVKHFKESLGNWSVHGVTIVVQTCCALKEIVMEFCYEKTFTSYE